MIFAILSTKIFRLPVSILTVALLCFLRPSAHAAQETTEQWGVFELSLPGPLGGNPFMDINFSATFTHGNSTVKTDGFYDGDGVYRVRFMPDTMGEWHYTTTSNVPDLSGKTGVFTVSKPSPGDRGPVHVANIYHFAYADGTPYKELGTTCYAWVHQGDALEEVTLKTLSTSPFNKIRMCIFPKHYAWNNNEPVLYPYAGTPPATWDFQRFNPKFFQHFEQRILDLQKLGIEADLILFHPYDMGHWGFDRMPADANDRYLRYVIARFGAYRNVWWSLANEWDFVRSKTEADFVHYGELVSSNDPYHHLLSIHNGAKIFNNNLPWITHASIQNGSAVEDVGRAELHRDVFRKPVVYDEVKYEGNIPERWGTLSAEEMVSRFWAGTVAGTYVGHGETYLSPDDVLWWSKGGVLKGQSPARLAFLKKVLGDSPAQGIDPIDKWQDFAYAGQAGSYYLIYLGKQTATSWEFQLPKTALQEGMQFTAEVLDTWNMTVTPAEGIFTLKKKDNYFFADQNARSITLPLKPYLAIRIKRVGN